MNEIKVKALEETVLTLSEFEDFLKAQGLCKAFYLSGEQEKKWWDGSQNVTMNMQYDHITIGYLPNSVILENPYGNLQIYGTKQVRIHRDPVGRVRSRLICIDAYGKQEVQCLLLTQ